MVVLSKQIQILFFLMLVSFCGIGQIRSELGANYNHDPELIDISLLERSHARWVRITPRFYNYLSDSFNPATDEGLQKIIQAKNAGYRVVFGFRFDFKQNNERIPSPNSDREREFFDLIGQILARIGQNIDIFTLGNEPNLETLGADMVYQDTHNGIPLVVFTERLLSAVVEPFYERRPSFNKPDIYAGSIPALFESTWQNNDGVVGLLELAQNDDRIKGFDLHMHISNFSEVDEAFSFARSIMPEKPFIITEFSLHRLYRNYINEKIGINQAGVDFASKYGYDPDWETYRWYTVVNSNQVEPLELEEFFDTREWFIPGYLQDYREKFDANGVVLATYPIYQQSAPLVLNSSSPLWFLNPVFMQVSLVPEENGALGANPLCYEDFLAWADYSNPITGLEDQVHSFTCYPNPGKDKLRFSTNEQKYPIAIKVYDLMGNMVLHKEQKSGIKELNIKRLISGVYLVNFRFDDGGLVEERLIISQ